MCVGVFVCGGEEGKRSSTKVQQNGWFGHEKQCQGPVLNFNCYYTQEKEKKESALRMKLRYKLKLEGF